MARNPIVPRNDANPVQTGRQVRRARGQIRKALKNIRRELMERFEQVQRQEITTNARYEYLLDAHELDNINEYIAELIERYVMAAANGDPIVVGQVELAYERATGQAVTNLSVQSEAFRRTVEETLLSQAYRSRIALVRSRVFEEMKGFTDQTRTDLARTLADGMAQGLGPRGVARNIRDRIGVAQSRAERIARTEINNAHRRASWDEDQQANQEGIETRLLWFSALSSSTRPDHASRHGRTYTQQEVKDFYARDGNAINCKCSTTSVLVDENGNPTSAKLRKRLREKGQEFFEASA